MKLNDQVTEKGAIISELIFNGLDKYLNSTYLDLFPIGLVDVIFISYRDNLNVTVGKYFSYTVSEVIRTGLLHLT